MANTHQVLEGVKEYTRDLIGVAFRDVAVDAADRAEAQAERAEAAADNAETGIRDDTITKQHLTPGLRDELDGKADQVATEQALSGKVDSTDVSVSLSQGRIVRRESDSANVRVSESPTQTYHAAAKSYVDGQVDGKADREHTHPLDQVDGLTSALEGKSPVGHTHTLVDFPNANRTDQVGSPANGNKILHTQGGTGWLVIQEDPVDGRHPARKSYVDSRIQLVTAWPASPTPGVLYLMEE